MLGEFVGCFGVVLVEGLVGRFEVIGVILGGLVGGEVGVLSGGLAQGSTGDGIWDRLVLPLLT